MMRRSHWEPVTPGQLYEEIVPELVDGYIRMAWRKAYIPCTIIVPVPERLGSWSPELEKLLLGHLIVESVRLYDNTVIHGPRGQILFNLMQQDLWAVEITCRPWNEVVRGTGLEMFGLGIHQVVGPGVQSS